MIKPIETYYNGYRFRSRIEARWAVFFDKMGIEYQYEPEGFDFGEVYYLPDFYLPKQKLWIEIKAEEPNSDELRKARLLKSHVSDGVEVGILYGEPWVTQDPELSFAIEEVHYCLMLIESWMGGDDANCLFSECRRCREFLFQETITSHCENSKFANGYIGYGCCDRMGLACTDKLKAAYSEARQARFEHGEKNR